MHPFQQPEGLAFTEEQQAKLVEAVAETQLELLAALRRWATSNERVAPWMVGQLSMSLRMLSLAGLPPTGGHFDGGFMGGWEEPGDIPAVHSGDEGMDERPDT